MSTKQIAPPEEHLKDLQVCENVHDEKLPLQTNNGLPRLRTCHQHRLLQFKCVSCTAWTPKFLLQPVLVSRYGNGNAHRTLGIRQKVGVQD